MYLDGQYFKYKPSNCWIIKIRTANINASTVNSQRLEGEITEDNEKIRLLKEEIEKREARRESVFQNKKKFELI